MRTKKYNNEDTSIELLNKYNEGKLIYCRFHDIVYKYINNESKKVVEYYNRLNPHILYDIIRKNKNFTINRERLVDLNKFQFILFYEYDYDLSFILTDPKNKIILYYSYGSLKISKFPKASIPVKKGSDWLKLPIDKYFNQYLRNRKDKIFGSKISILNTNEIGHKFLFDFINQHLLSFEEKGIKNKIFFFHFRWEYATNLYIDYKKQINK